MWYAKLGKEGEPGMWRSLRSLGLQEPSWCCNPVIVFKMCKLYCKMQRRGEKVRRVYWKPNKGWYYDHKREDSIGDPGVCGECAGETREREQVNDPLPDQHYLDQCSDELTGELHPTFRGWR